MFLSFIKENDLINKGDKILIAFSGGPDSVFLFEKLLSIKDEYNLEIHLAYVNHNIRDDVYKDIEFVKFIANKYNTNYSILDIKMDKFSEGVARDLRYKVLEEERLRIGFNKIATGHNKTDNAETIIFRIIRGTHLEGLNGIKLKRGNIIRPILYIKKEDVLKQVSNDYIIDKTNLENDYSRNKIRNLVFPIFEDINTSFIDNIVKLSRVNENDEIRDMIIEKLKKYNIKISSRKIDDIYKIYFSNGSKIIDLGNEYVAYKSYDKFSIIKKDEINNLDYEYVLKYGEEIKIENYYIGYTKLNLLEKKSDYEYNIYSSEYLKKDTIFKVRNRKNGDKLGDKKIKKIFIDNKIDKLERNRMPIVLVEDKIIMIGIKFKEKNQNSGQFCIYIRREDGRKR
ncbi:tRNA lysidine(34) synthetase TilS [Pseudostreptobacillus hongkongensis]|uniref:tRNA lysidine(34) synthetase TilS n=1 Tax=Pseudostreptobacillus hongkongensis TaxID=1162717 RepID=UPI0028D67F9E|nr:tRNA lysidine(34) synthetase TilS [Pseudostreptobacillus hongkongensis]